MKFILMTTWLILDRVFVALELDPGTVSRVLEWNSFKFIEKYARGEKKSGVTPLDIPNKYLKYFNMLKWTLNIF